MGRGEHINIMTIERRKKNTVGCTKETVDVCCMRYGTCHFQRFGMGTLTSHCM